MWAMVPITPKQKQIFCLEAHFHELAPERGAVDTTQPNKSVIRIRL